MTVFGVLGEVHERWMAGIHGVHDRPAADAKPVVRRLCAPCRTSRAKALGAVVRPVQQMVPCVFVSLALLGPACSHAGKGACLQVWAGQRLRGRSPWLSVRPSAKGPACTAGKRQRRHGEHHPGAFAQVRCHMEMQAGAYCKTVGSAYVGSNPTPATISENGPYAAETRLGGPFLFVVACISARHHASMHCDVHGHIADGDGGLMVSAGPRCVPGRRRRRACPRRARRGQAAAGWRGWCRVSSGRRGPRGCRG